MFLFPLRSNRYAELLEYGILINGTIRCTQTNKKHKHRGSTTTIYYATSRWHQMYLSQMFIYFPPSLFFFLPLLAPVALYVLALLLLFFLWLSSSSHGNFTLSYFKARSKHHNRRATPDNVARRKATICDYDINDDVWLWQRRILQRKQKKETDNC